MLLIYAKNIELEARSEGRHAGFLRRVERSENKKGIGRFTMDICAGGAAWEMALDTEPVRRDAGLLADSERFHHL